jgi:hypothetical protein
MLIVLPSGLSGTTKTPAFQVCSITKKCFTTIRHVSEMFLICCWTADIKRSFAFLQWRHYGQGGFETIELQFYGGMRSGVNATPGFFINGEKLNSGWEGDELLKFIRDRFPQFM